MRKVKSLNGKYYTVIDAYTSGGDMIYLSFQASDGCIYNTNAYLMYKDNSFDFDSSIVGKKFKVYVDKNDMILSMMNRKIKIDFRKPKCDDYLKYIDSVLYSVEPKVTYSFLGPRKIITRLKEASIREELMVWAFHTSKKDVFGSSMAFTISYIANTILDITDSVLEVNNMIEVLLVTRKATPKMVANGINTDKYNQCLIMFGLKLAREYLRLSNKRDIIYSHMHYPGRSANKANASYNDILNLFFPNE